MSDPTGLHETQVDLGAGIHCTAHTMPTPEEAGAFAVCDEAARAYEDAVYAAFLSYVKQAARVTWMDEFAAVTAAEVKQYRQEEQFTVGDAWRLAQDALEKEAFYVGGAALVLETGGVALAGVAAVADLADTLAAVGEAVDSAGTVLDAAAATVATVNAVYQCATGTPNCAVQAIDATVSLSFLGASYVIDLNHFDGQRLTIDDITSNGALWAASPLTTYLVDRLAGVAWEESAQT
jgi:hypothetical protein